MILNDNLTRTTAATSHNRIPGESRTTHTHTHEGWLLLLLEGFPQPGPVAAPLVELWRQDLRNRGGVYSWHKIGCIVHLG